MIKIKPVVVTLPDPPEQKEEILAPYPCGIVLFDHPNDFSAGSAFLPDSGTQRIRSLNDLRNDVLWISNLRAQEDRINNHPVVRNNYFFKQNLTQMTQDIGVPSSSDAQMAPEDAQSMATIATRALTIAARAYGWAEAGNGIGVMQEKYLYEDIRKGLPRAPSPDARWRDSLRVVFSQAYQEHSQPSWPSVRWRGDSVYVTLRFNYVSYMKSLLDQPVPLNKQWSRMDASGIALLEDPVAHFFDKPSFVRATVEWDNATSEVAALAAYGQAGRTKNTMRLWISQPELRWLSQYATITIIDAWVDESGMGRLPPEARLPNLFSVHPNSLLSYSSHLIAYNHYQAITSERWNSRERRKEVDLWAVWIKALDRAFMFSIALKAEEKGLLVERYGDGSLVVKVERNQAQELAEFKEDQGFMYPDLSLVFHTTTNNI